MPARGTITPLADAVLRLKASGVGCKEIARRLGTTMRAVCATANRWEGRTPKRRADADDKGANMTEAEVEALVARQMANKPRWWRAETPQETRLTATPGRAAEVVRTRSGWVHKKGKR